MVDTIDTHLSLRIEFTKPNLSLKLNISCILRLLIFEIYCSVFVMREGENGTIPLHKYLVRTNTNKRSTLKAISKGKFMHKIVNLIR